MDASVGRARMRQSLGDIVGGAGLVKATNRFVGQKLRCRAALIDWRALSLIEGEQPLAERPSLSIEIRKPDQLLAAGKTNELLLSEIRDELRRRGGSTIGKRWELVPRLEKMVEKEKAAAAAAEPASDSQPSVADRYAERLRSKTGGAGAALLAAARGDRASQAEAVAAHQEAALAGGADVGGTAGATGGGGWNLQPGAGALLGYLDLRGMARALLPSEAAADDDAAAAHAAAACQKLAQPPFGHVVGLDGAAALRRGDEAAVRDASEALGVPPSALVVVSDADAVLNAARRAGAVGVYVKKAAPGAKARVAGAEHCVEGMDGVRDAVEEINGVSWRSAAAG